MTEAASSAVATLKQSLGRLDVQRKSLEMEGEAIASELTAPAEGGGEPMGIDTPLVDLDGYPRGDVDVYRARALRGRLAVIRTDRKALMEQINNLLVQLASMQNPNKSEELAKEEAARAALKPKPKYDAKTGKWVVQNWDGTVAGVPNGEALAFDTLSHANPPAAAFAASTTTTSNLTNISAAGPPFAKIDAVAAISPAFEAGLKVGDLITEFGPVHHGNHQNLKALMPVVSAAADEEQAIAITLLRRHADPSTATQVVRVRLSPRPWPGRGLIGCHIVPYSQE